MAMNKIRTSVCSVTKAEVTEDRTHHIHGFHNLDLINMIYNLV